MSEERNADLLEEWYAKQMLDATYPDAWAPVARLWFDRFLSGQRLRARQWLLARRAERRRAEAALKRAHQRWGMR